MLHYFLIYVLPAWAAWVTYVLGYHIGNYNGKKLGTTALRDAQLLATRAAGDARRARNLTASARYASGTL